MSMLQLHRVMYFDAYSKQLRAQSSWSKPRCCICLLASSNRLPSSLDINLTAWAVPVSKNVSKTTYMGFGTQQKLARVVAYSIAFPSKELATAVKAATADSFTSFVKFVQQSHLFRQCAPAVAVMAFAMWGLGPVLRVFHRTILQEEDSSWKDSQMHYVFRSFVRPLLLWIGVIVVCRAFDPIVLSTEASQAIKQRFLNFVRSLSTVLAFAQCSMSLSQQLQSVISDGQSTQDSRSLGAQFVNNAVYTAVWVAAVCLFMELLGFSTQKWLTAGGLGTVLLTLAGREIFTNFLSSIMIHATRPFVLNEWIQTKIDGYEVSGTVEHVGWWSPTIVRGDDREAVHIPNHKFTVSVVRNLSQKSHWRIKAHFGISHLDVSKVPNIVADMRKVLAKHPQVEQRRLHRRVFFDYINPENQAIMVLVSCFVKTPHFEENLRVKEVILLDLLKVISHHHARLATPIRSVQRVQEDIESRTSPFRDMNRTAESQSKPYLLVEATAVSSGQRDSEQFGMSKNGTLNSKEVAAGSDASEVGSSNELESPADSKVPGKHKPQLEGLDSMGLNSKDITLLGAAFEKPPVHIPESSEDMDRSSEKASFKPAADSSLPLKQAVSVRLEKGHIKSLDSITPPSGKKVEMVASKAVADSDPAQPREDKGSLQEESNEPDLQSLRKEEIDLRHDSRRSQSAVQGTPSKLDIERELGGAPAAKAQLEENLVLGVALDGPKRTLPLDEVAVVTEQKELVASRNGNSSTLKERRDSSQAPSPNTSETRER